MCYIIGANKNILKAQRTRNRSVIETAKNATEVLAFLRKGFTAVVGQQNLISPVL